MQHTALITGASSGIGRALAREHAQRGRDVVLLARRKNALEELAAELEQAYGVATHVIARDLTEPDTPAAVYQELLRERIEIDYLFNNAGFGGHGLFHEREWNKDLAMIEVNIVALTALTREFLPAMVTRRRGKILNTSSTAGFMPGPLQAVYYATKAYVNSFSQAIAEEVKAYGITVTALCPGPVDTEFAETADLEGTDMFKTAATPAQVAEQGYAAMEKGKLIEITDWKLAALINVGLPLIPRWTQLKLIRDRQEK